MPGCARDGDDGTGSIVHGTTVAQLWSLPVREPPRSANPVQVCGSYSRLVGERGFLGVGAHQRGSRIAVEAKRSSRHPWAWLLSRVFAVDVLTCERCEGREGAPSHGRQRARGAQSDPRQGWASARRTLRSSSKSRAGPTKPMKRIATKGTYVQVMFSEDSVRGPVTVRHLGRPIGAVEVAALMHSSYRSFSESDRGRSAGSLAIFMSFMCPRHRGQTRRRRRRPRQTARRARRRVIATHRSPTRDPATTAWRSDPSARGCRSLRQVRNS